MPTKVVGMPIASLAAEGSLEGIPVAEQSDEDILSDWGYRLDWLIRKIAITVNNSVNNEINAYYQRLGIVSHLELTSVELRAGQQNTRTESVLFSSILELTEKRPLGQIPHEDLVAALMCGKSPYFFVLKISYFLDIKSPPTPTLATSAPPTTARGLAEVIAVARSGERQQPQPPSNRKSATNTMLLELQRQRERDPGVNLAQELGKKLNCMDPKCKNRLPRRDFTWC